MPTAALHDRYLCQNPHTLRLLSSSQLSRKILSFPLVLSTSRNAWATYWGTVSDRLYYVLIFGKVLTQHDSYIQGSQQPWNNFSQQLGIILNPETCKFCSFLVVSEKLSCEFWKWFAGYHSELVDDDVFRRIFEMANNLGKFTHKLAELSSYTPENYFAGQRT